MKNKNIGTVYLICFEKHFKHARHYLGFTQVGEKREQRHIDGNGSKLLRAVDKAGIAFQVVRTWEGVDRHFERKLKKQKNSKNLCPRCKGVNINGTVGTNINESQPNNEDASLGFQKQYETAIQSEV